MSNKATEKDMELINKYSRRTLKEDEVYTFSVVLCDNDIDRDIEHFDDEALDTLKDLFVGVSAVYDHEPSAKNQIARIYSCGCEMPEGRLTAYNEPYKRLVGKAYIPVCGATEDLIALLDSGIMKEVSIGCAVAKCRCSICGEDMRTSACSHVKGRHYGGKMCCGVLSEPTDAYEWSFTAVPSQRSAGVTKSSVKKWRGAEDSMGEYIDALRKQAEEGRRYKSALRLETVKAGIMANVGIESKLLEKMTAELSVEELTQLKEAFVVKAQQRLPIGAQSRRGREKPEKKERFKEYEI